MDTSAATVVVWRPLMTPGSSARSGEDLRRRVLAFVRKATPFAYCDACLALRLECSLAEMAAALADLADGDAVLARAPLLLRLRPHARDQRAAGRTAALTSAGAGSVATHALKTSATLHAWAMQPRGLNGGSASKISLMEPMHDSLR